MNAAGVVRGCGTRKRGGIYASCGLSDYGMPIEYFLIDPPISADGFDLTAIGVKLIEREGAWHVVDVVGGDSYPNVADFIEETKRFGLSRRLPKTLDFSKLDERSRIILAHKRGIIENCRDYYDILNQPLFAPQCPKRLPQHTADERKFDADEMCAALWWRDIDQKPVERRGDQVTRVMPSFEYRAHTRPDVDYTSYKLGLFASFPIHNLDVIRDDIAGTHEVAETVASQSKLPVNLEDA